MSETDELEVYFNDKQLEFFAAKVRVKCAVCGRGFGKSNLPAVEILDWVDLMPQARCLYVALTYDQIDESFGEILKRWDAMGLVDGTNLDWDIDDDFDYVIDKEPPYWFDKPLKRLKNYSNTVTFRDGFTIIKRSLRDAKSKRGGSFDCAIVEEAAFTKKAVFDHIVQSSLRGNAGRYPSSVHRSLLILTSRPTAENPEGRWVYQYEALMKAYPDEYFYLEAGAIHNKDALGGDKWIEEKKREMGALRFAVEIENVKLAQSETAFYHKFERSRNTYTPQKDVKGNMLDVIPTQLLEISWDFGGWFTGCIVMQEDYKAGEDRLLRRYYVKEKGTWKDVVKDFCDDNTKHEFKYVRIWGDPSGFKRSEHEAVHTYDSMQKELALYGWSSEVKAWNDPSYLRLSYVARHEFMNSFLSGALPMLPMPRINIECCEDTVVSIEEAERLADGSLNKALEKDRAFPQELATHQANMFDYYYYCKYSVRVNSNSSGRSGRVD